MALPVLAAWSNDGKRRVPESPSPVKEKGRTMMRGMPDFECERLQLCFSLRFRRPVNVCGIERIVFAQRSALVSVC